MICRLAPCRRCNRRDRRGRLSRWERRGNALVLAITLVAILALMGSTFIIVSRLDRESVRSVNEQADLDAVQNIVVSTIGNVLAQDLMGKKELGSGLANDPDGDGVDLELVRNFLAEPTRSADTASPQPTVGAAVRPVRFFPGTGANINLQSEPYDLPAHTIDPVNNQYNQSLFYLLAGSDGFLGTQDDRLWLAGDPWLADLEPDVSGTPFWRHISDVQGQLAELTFDEITDDGTDDSPMSGAGDLEPPSASHFDFTTVRAYIVDPTRDSPSGDFIPDEIQAVGYPADADGDGVTDARWIRWRTDPNSNSPYLRTPEGHDVYVAVRIVDNSGMLNLNTSGYGNGTGSGRNLTDVDYRVIRRHTGDLDAALWDERVEEGKTATPDTYNEFLVDLVNPPGRWTSSLPNEMRNYNLFTLVDELEMRNRGLISSRTIARFESRSVWPLTFDPTEEDEDDYSIPPVRREPFGPNDSLTGAEGRWTQYFDATLADTYYDRRHLTTFHSWDRTLRAVRYPAQTADTGTPQAISTYLTIMEDRPKLFPEFPNLPDLSDLDLEYIKRNFAPLIFGFRAYFLDEVASNGAPVNNVQTAARKAAQVMANLIDYVDTSELLEGIGSQSDTSPLFANMDSGAPVELEDPFPGGTRTFASAVMQKKGHVTRLTNNIIETLIKLHPQAEGGVDVDHPDNVGEIGTVEAPGDRVNSPYPRNGANFVGVEFGMDPQATVIGYEPQPFITQILCLYKYQEDLDPMGQPYVPPRVKPLAPAAFAVELYNPYKEAINLDGWQIVTGTFTYVFPDTTGDANADTAIQAGRSLIVMTTPGSLNGGTGIPSGQAGHPELWTSDNALSALGDNLLPSPPNPVRLVDGFEIGRGDTVFLERPVVRPLRPWVVVDSVDGRETAYIHANDHSDNPSGPNALEPYEKIFSSRRGGNADPSGTTNWAFTNNHSNSSVAQSNYKQEEILVLANGLAQAIPGFNDPEPGGGAQSGSAHPLGLGRRLLSNVLFDTPPRPGYVLNLNTRIVKAGGPKVSNILSLASDRADMVARIGHGSRLTGILMPITEVIAAEVSTERHVFLSFEPLKFNASGVTDYAADGSSLLDYFTFIRKERTLAEARELRMHGRVNLNTAPKMVLEAVLTGAGVSNPETAADNIIAYRDKATDKATAQRGFYRVAELYDAGGANQLLGSQADKVVNLFTVRSDVVTAYMAIRVQDPGQDSADPSDDTLVSERRLMVIYDRAGVYEPGDQPRVLAAYEVPGVR